MEVVGTAVWCEGEDLDRGDLLFPLHLSTSTPYRQGHSPPVCGWHICFVKINTVIITLYYVDFYLTWTGKGNAVFYFKILDGNLQLTTLVFVPVQYSNVSSSLCWCCFLIMSSAWKLRHLIRERTEKRIHFIKTKKISFNTNEEWDVMPSTNILLFHILLLK